MALKHRQPTRHPLGVVRILDAALTTDYVRFERDRVRRRKVQSAVTLIVLVATLVLAIAALASQPAPRSAGALTIIPTLAPGGWQAANYLTYVPLAMR